MLKPCKSVKRLRAQVEATRFDGTMVVLHPETLDWLLRIAEAARSHLCAEWQEELDGLLGGRRRMK